MNGQNPYKFPPGPALDRLIAEKLFETDGSNSLDPFSTEEKAADRVKSKLKTTFGHAVITGRTRIPENPWFARFDTGPSTSTEVIADTYPLAICRLALVVSTSHKPRK